MNKDLLRKLIREIIIDELNEMSTTGGVAGYSTPYAFTGNFSKLKKKMKDNAEQNGLKLTDKGKEELNRKPDPVKHETIEDVNLKEGKSRYHTFKSNPEQTSKQKIGIAIRETKKALKEIDSQLKILTRFKNEIGYNRDNYWKRTKKDIYKIEGLLLNVAKKLREIKV